jgi:hypothetical protein
LFIFVSPFEATTPELGKARIECATRREPQKSTRSIRTTEHALIACKVSGREAGRHLMRPTCGKYGCRPRLLSGQPLSHRQSYKAGRHAGAQQFREHLDEIEAVLR